MFTPSPSIECLIIQSSSETYRLQNRDDQVEHIILILADSINWVLVTNIIATILAMLRSKQQFPCLYLKTVFSLMHIYIYIFMTK